jgi:threonine dehydrogenase-like Zn-dependent dehydrogenase
MHKFDCLFDCLGGGPITEALISPLRPYSKIFMYGTLEDKPIVITSTLHILKSLSI